MSLCGHADIIIFLPEACWNSRLLPPCAYSQHVSLVPPASSLSFFVLAFLARVCLNSRTLFPLIYPTPFFFLSLHFLLKNILYSIDRRSSETIFLFSMVRRKILGILNLPTISHLNKLASWTCAASPTYSNCCIPRLPVLSLFLFHSLFYLQPAQNVGVSPSL